MPAPTPTAISGNCCIEFPNITGYGKGTTEINLLVSDDLSIAKNLQYHINFGDGDALRSGVLSWDNEKGYSIKVPHVYHNIGTFKTFVLIENLHTNRRGKCGTMDVIVLTPTPTPTLTTTPTATTTITPTATNTPSITPTLTATCLLYTSPSPRDH